MCHVLSACEVLQKFVGLVLEIQLLRISWKMQCNSNDLQYTPTNNVINSSLCKSLTIYQVCWNPVLWMTRYENHTHLETRSICSLLNYTHENIIICYFHKSSNWIWCLMKSPSLWDIAFTKIVKKNPQQCHLFGRYTLKSN